MSQDHVVHIIEPDKSIVESLTVLLETYNLSVCTFSDAESYLEFQASSAENPCCLLVASNLPGKSGPLLVQQIRTQYYHFPIIMLTDTDEREIRRQARRSGATEVVSKPLMNSVLLQKLAQFCIQI